MNYKGIKVLEINPVVYLGDEFKDKSFKENQDFFKEKIKNSEFSSSFCYECPINDMICISVDYDDNLVPRPKHDTINKIFSVLDELLKIFNGDKIKISVSLDGNIDGMNLVELSISEFIEYLFLVCKK